jgi:hypothetical protein
MLWPKRTNRLNCDATGVPARNKTLQTTLDRIIGRENNLARAPGVDQEATFRDQQEHGRP